MGFPSIQGGICSGVLTGSIVFGSFHLPINNINFLSVPLSEQPYFCDVSFGYVPEYPELNEIGHWDKGGGPFRSAMLEHHGAQWLTVCCNDQNEHEEIL